MLGVQCSLVSFSIKLVAFLPAAMLVPKSGYKSVSLNGISDFANLEQCCEQSLSVSAFEPLTLNPQPLNPDRPKFQYIGNLAV